MPTVGNEVFQNPIVKQVVFQVRFPTLLFLKSRIGDFQLAIMDQFPQSEVLTQQSVLFAKGFTDEAIREIGEESEGHETIWKFHAPTGAIIELKLDSLTIISREHKSYQSDPDRRFRDVIDFAINALLRVAPVPSFSRVGMRYVDELPLPDDTSQTLTSYIQTTFDFEKYPLDDLLDMRQAFQIRRDATTIRIVNVFKRANDRLSVVLDFDAFQTNVDAAALLPCADALHQAIRHEFELSITDRVIEYMRGQP